MAVKQKNYVGSRTEYTATYRDMLGVDLSTDGFGISTRRFAYMENMYRDYDGFGAALTESVPGFRTILKTGERINGIYSRFGSDTRTHIVVHAGTHLYTFLLDSPDTATKSPIFTLADRKSHARAYGDSLYLFDGDGIIRINDSGAVRVRDGAEASPYVPTTYLNGEEYEQRNLLTKRFKERTFIGSCSAFSHGTRGFSYEVLSDEGGTAILTYGGDAEGDVHIPGKITLHGRSFTVAKIGNAAFRNNGGIRSLTIAEGVTEIGGQAFSGCPFLEEVITPDSLEIIGSSAFSDCQSLEKFYLGGGIRRFGGGCFYGSANLIELDYAMDVNAFSLIENYQETTNITINFEQKNLKRTVEIPIYTPTSFIQDLTLEGNPISYEAITEGELIKSIVIRTDNRYDFEGRELEILAEINDSAPHESSTVPDVLALAEGMEAHTLILGCTVSESFDGRIFVGGNPALPNTVFYTARDKSGFNNPLYFGSLNYFSDGVGGHSVKALLATSNMLAVFKSGDDGCGSIFYHSPQDTEFSVIPKIYPVEFIHSGIYAAGGAISFFDDPIFVSPLGICALEKQAINLERSVTCRSHNVNTSLLSEKLDSVRLTEWCGYLVALANGRIYLADSRSTFTHPTGSVEYEWYLLSGIGTYSGDSPVYRYASTEREGYTLHPTPYLAADGTVFSTQTEDGTVYYVEKDGARFEVLPTEELTGGVFSPAVEALGIYDRLFFGTESGDICIFNNDKRGVAPERISSLADFSPEEYKEKMGRRIHTDFYSFAGHAPRYALKTAFDNCAIPHLTKNTVRDSLTLKCRAFTESSLVCEVGTDVSGYKETTSFPGGEIDFSTLNFTTLTSNTHESFTVAISERERGWIEKQITLYSDEFASPFGIYSISYRFTVKGKIKKH